MVTQREPGNYHQSPTPCCKCTSQQGKGRPEHFTDSFTTWPTYSSEGERQTDGLSPLQTRFRVINKNLLMYAKQVRLSLRHISTSYPRCALVLDCRSQRGVTSASPQESSSLERKKKGAGMGSLFLLAAWISVGRAHRGGACRSTAVTA